MDDIEDDGWYPPIASGLSSSHESANPRRIIVKNIPAPQNVGSEYDDDDDDEDDQDIDEQEEENDGGDDDDNNGVQCISNADYSSGDADNDDEDYDDRKKHTKKRKLTSLLSRYEFVPRVPALPVVVAPPPRAAIGGRNSLTDWTEHETFVLLETWGDKFLQYGRKSLRLEEWQEVAKKVSQESKVERSDTQCRNRLDTLKKKYKKEKAKMEGDRNLTTRWVYFQKLDMLLSTSAHQGVLSSVVDSGENVCKSSKVYLNHANGWDETRDSPGTLARVGEEESDSEGLPPKKKRNRRSQRRGALFKLLADSIQKFTEVYEKTESNKRKQMQELENMRMDFHRELEFQKRQILEREQAKIAIIRQGNDEHNASAENVSSRYG